MNNQTHLFPRGDFPTDERSAFLNILREVAAKKGTYKYLEIGSYLGGSISPLLVEESCTEVISIDKRGRNQPDERGRDYDYTHVTEQHMLDNLKSNGYLTDKIRCFDGSIEEFSFTASDKFRFVLIDGEHTDFACFRDFTYLKSHLERDAIVIFDDANLTIKGIKNVFSLLESEGVPFKASRILKTRFVVIRFGCFQDNTFVSEIRENDLDSYFKKCEEELFWVNIRHRVSLNRFLKLWLIQKPVIAASYSRLQHFKLK